MYLPLRTRELKMAPPLLGGLQESEKKYVRKSSARDEKARMGELLAAAGGSVLHVGARVCSKAALRRVLGVVHGRAGVGAAKGGGVGGVDRRGLGRTGRAAGHSAGDDDGEGPHARAHHGECVARGLKVLQPELVCIKTLRKGNATTDGAGEGKDESQDRKSERAR